MSWSTSPPTGPRATRLRRLYHHGSHGLLVTPLDHTLASGPLPDRGGGLDGLVRELALGGSDAVVVHKGAVRRIDSSHLVHVSLVVHLNGSTATAPDPDAKVLLTSVEEALRLGADAVSVHVNLGSATEAQQLGDLARVGEACDRWNVPLLAMVYPRGPGVADPRDPELVLRAVTVGADLGADLVKTVQLPDPAEQHDVVRACPVPVLVAGGPLRPEGRLLGDVDDAMAAGAGGVAVGRCAFAAPDPRLTTARVADLVHRHRRPPGLPVPPRPATHGTNPDTTHDKKKEDDHVDDLTVLLARPAPQPIS